MARSGRMSHCIMSEKFVHCMTPPYSHATFSTKTRSVKECQPHGNASVLLVNTYRCNHSIDRNSAGVEPREEAGVSQKDEGQTWRTGARYIYGPEHSTKRPTTRPGASPKGAGLSQEAFRLCSPVGSFKSCAEVRTVSMETGEKLLSIR